MANADYSGGLTEREQIDTAARAFGFELVPLPVRRMEDIALALDGLKGGVEALYTTGDPLVNTHQLRIITFALVAPAYDVFATGVRCRGWSNVIWTQLSGPEPAGSRLCRQGPTRREPDTLPVEQPTKFDLAIT
jgi:hypothetical protein